jgi:hypothetical protein
MSIFFLSKLFVDLNIQTFHYIYIQVWLFFDSEISRKCYRNMIIMNIHFMPKQFLNLVYYCHFHRQTFIVYYFLHLCTRLIIMMIQTCPVQWNNSIGTLTHSCRWILCCEIITYYFDYSFIANILYKIDK